MHLLEIVSAKKSNGVITHLRQLLPALAARGHRGDGSDAYGKPVQPKSLEQWVGRRSDVRSASVAGRRAETHRRLGEGRKSGRDPRAHEPRQQLRRPAPATDRDSVRPDRPRACLASALARSRPCDRGQRGHGGVAPPLEQGFEDRDRAELRRSGEAGPERGRERENPGPSGALGRASFSSARSATLIPRKGVDVLASAARQSSKRPREPCSSGGAKRNSVESLKRAAGERAIWAGFRTDIPDVLSALDGFVLASRRDPCPMAVIEAMAAGLPVVGSRVRRYP